MTVPIIAGRDAAGRYTGEQNPGRALGSRNRVRADKRALATATLDAVQATGSEAIRQLRLRVAEGDLSAIRFVLEWCLPKGGRTIELGSSDPNALLDAIANGDVSPDEAARLAQALKTTAEASEIKELKSQIAELEVLVLSMNSR